LIVNCYYFNSTINNQQSTINNQYNG